MESRLRLHLLIFFSVLFIAVPSKSFADGEEHERYCSMLKDKLGVELTAPAGSFQFLPDTFAFAKSSVICFGDSHPELGPAGFVVGPTVKLNEHCSVVMMEMEMQSKPHPAHLPEPCDYTFAKVSAWMLNNCGEPWAPFYIYNIRGVLNDNVAIPSEEEQRAMQERADALRVEYECCIEEGEVLEKTNCDRLFIVRIPDIAKIGTNPDFAHLVMPGYIENLKSGATQCYGVEFYRKANYWPLKMLFFINADEISIDECVADIAEYIKFEDIDFE